MNKTLRENEGTPMDGTKTIYSQLKTTDDKIDDIFEDLIVGHNFDYASNEIKKLLAQEVAAARLEGAQAENELWTVATTVVRKNAESRHDKQM